MKGNSTAALVLVIVGALKIAYGLYRVFTMEQSMLPLLPVGLMGSAIGVVLLTRSDDRKKLGPGTPGDG